MQWVAAKSSSDVKLDSVTIAFTTEDKSVTEIIIRDKVGGVMRITKADAYGRSINAYIPAPPEKKKVFVVSGRFKDLVDISEAFDEKYEAESRLRDLKSADYSNDDFKIIEQEIEVAAAE